MCARAFAIVQINMVQALTLSLNAADDSNDFIKSIKCI